MAIPELASAIPIVRSHHEQWNGAGYPDGLAGEQIPLMARIVAVADAFDAMTTDRPYRSGVSLQSAFEEINDKAGKQFDPQVAAAFLRQRARVEDTFSQRVIYDSEGESLDGAPLSRDPPSEPVVADPTGQINLGYSLNR
jgi:HD-GYP domain-containing protein (c-di-GMP phosphodiesterase class II)